jgi:hypothetical protein
LIHADFRVLEFGSGGSTLYFKENVSYVYSVEHDAKWFEVVKSICRTSNNIELNLITPELDKNAPEKYRSKHGLFSEGQSFRNYSHGADHLQDAYFDLLLIDGRARSTCLENSISKLKPGGILIFDNSDRESYQDIILKLLEGWEIEKFAGVTIFNAFFNQTSIFIMCIRKDARELDLGQEYADTRPQTTVNSPQQYSIGAQAIIYLVTCS